MPEKRRTPDTREAKLAENLAAYEAAYYTLMLNRRGLTKEAITKLADEDNIELMVTAYPDDVEIPELLDTLIKTYHVPNYTLESVELYPDTFFLQTRLDTEDWEEFLNSDQQTSKIEINLREGGILVAPLDNKHYYIGTGVRLTPPLPVLEAVTTFMQAIQKSDTPIEVQAI